MVPATPDAPAAADDPAAAATIAPGVAVRDHPLYGRCAFANRAFAAGEIVVKEAPLVVCAEGGAGSAPDDDPAGAWLTRAFAENVPAVRAACKGGATPDDLRRLCVCYLAFCAAAPEAREAVLRGMLNEAGPDAADALVVQRAQHAAGFICEVLAPRGAADGTLRDPPGDAATVLRVLLSFELNAHAVGGRGALFAVGSKFTHTCGQPNSVFKSCGGLGYHVALRDIAPGELLTTTYLEGGAMLMATPYREVFTLEGFGFRCRCPRCAAPADDMRCLPCPRCATAATRRGGDGLLPKSVALKGARPPGVLTYTAGLAAQDGSSSSGGSGGGGEGPGTAAASWVCGSCGAALPDDDAALFGGGERVAEVAGLAPNGRVERGAGALVHQADRDMGEGRASRAGVARLLEVVARLLGPDHWSTVAMMRGHSEMLLAELRSAASNPTSSIGSAVSALLEDLQSNWKLRCSWVDSRSGLDAAHTLFQEIVAHACALYEAYPPLARALGAPHPAAARLLSLAAWLRGRVVPALGVLKAGWPLPEPLGMVAVLDAAAAAAAAAGAPVAALEGADGSSGGGGLPEGGGGEGPSMQQLLDFLPSSGGSGKGGKAKKKKSGSGGGGGRKK